MTDSDTDFLGLVTSAYHALYDLVALRTHPLVGLLVDATLPAKEQGWQLHNLLLDAIRQLDPGPQAPTTSKEWRRHQLMTLRYVEGLDPQAVAEQLAFSRRQFYREHGAALEAAAAILHSQRQNAASTPTDPTQGLLRSEFERVSEHEQAAHLSDVLAGVLQLLGPLAHEHQIQIDTQLDEPLPALAVNTSLLRQLLLAILGAIATHSRNLTLTLRATGTASTVQLDLTLDPPDTVADAVGEQTLPYTDILASSGIDIDGLRAHGPLRRLTLALPAFLQTPVLVIDDNEDVLALYERYLTPNNFQVTATSDAESALELAVRLKPALIIIDLMMPQTDGWEMLRQLRQQAADDIPVLICSVLKQRDLALALGAQHYLEKPITERGLLDAIRQVLG